MPYPADRRDLEATFGLLVLAVLAALVCAVASCSAVAFGADCAARNTSCKSRPCCAGLYCNASLSCKTCTAPSDGPECGGATTTTSSPTSTTRTTTSTPATSSSTTPTTRPGGTTTTTRPTVALAMYDPTLGDVGLHWTGQSQEMMYNHQTGRPLDQADAWGLLLYLRLVVEPELIAAASEVPTCASTVPKMLEGMKTTTDKFLVDYVLRPVLTGGTYAVHGNYHWDLTHNLYLEPFRDCLVRDAKGNAAWLATHPRWMPALDLRVADGKIVKGDTTYVVPDLCADTLQGGRYSCARAKQVGVDKKALQQGAVAARFADVPLSPQQCAALAAFRKAHDQSSGVPAAGDAFVATARTKREQTLFHMPFTTQRHPQRDPAVAAALEARKHAGFAEWQRCFGCETGQPPDFPCIAVGLFRHVIPHSLLALPPGARLREVCDATAKRSHRTGNVNCPWIQG